MRRFHRPLLTLALLVVASPLLAYTIYLKDGSTLLAREKYKVSGNTAMITLHNGAQTTLRLDQIDVAKTDAGNASDYGDATVLAVPQPPPKPQQPLPSQNLAGVLAHQHSTLPAPAPSMPPKPAAAAPPAAIAGGLARTSAGYVDFMRAPRTPITRVDLGTLLSERMRQHGVESAGIYEGSRPRRVLIELTTNSEGAVFQGIAAAAQSMLDVEAQRPGSLDAIELFLATDRRQRAGQFLITTDRANELKTRQIDLTAFYLKYVEF